MTVTRFSPDIDEFAKLCAEYKSSVLVARYYNVSRQTVCSLADKLQIPIRSTQKLSEEQISYIESNYSNKLVSSRELGEKFGVSKSLIIKIWKRFSGGIKRPTRKYTLDNETLFRQINPDVAYFAGFITADGCVYKPNSNNKQNILRISLKNEDEYILYYFNNLLHTDKPLLHITKHNSTYDSIISTMEISSNIIVSDLELLGIHPRKTKLKNEINIPLKYMLHYIHGYFDGDGSIYKKAKSGEEMASDYTISISGYEKSLQVFIDYFSSLGIFFNFSADKRSNPSTVAGRFGNMRITNIYSMYSFAKLIQTYGNKKCLKRKKDKLVNLVNLVDNSDSVTSSQIKFYYDAVYTKYMDMCK